MGEESKVNHEQDLAFMAEVKAASDEHLQMLLKFQACEFWRKILIMREIDRRKNKHD